MIGLRYVVATPSSARVGPYAALLLAVLALGLARLVTGPWYQVYNPWGTVDLEGWPVAWEAIYYLVHFPTFAGNAPPSLGIAPVHERTFINLFLSAALYGWSRSAFWSIAAVDLFMWFVAAVATFHLGRRLGAERLPAGIAAGLTASSPIMVSNMWCHYLHIANFATMAVGLWAALVLVQEVRRPIRLSGALGVLLLVLSLGYQYQWIMVPMLGVLLVSRGGMRPRMKCLVLLGAILFYVLSAAGVRGALDLAGLARSEAYGGVVSEPGVLIRAKLAAVRSVADLPTLLPHPSLVVEMAQTYHPLVFGVGAAGLWLLPPRARWLALVCSAAALGSLSLYPRPWTAMSAYPLIYLGAAMSCVATGMTIGRLVARAGTLGSSPIAVTAAVRLVTVVLALGLAAVTNLDLIGDPRFLLSFWRLYARPAVF